jgi:hypothetical protein
MDYTAAAVDATKTVFIELLHILDWTIKSGPSGNGTSSRT